MTSAPSYVVQVPDSLRRVTIHRTEAFGHSHEAIDFTLPADYPVADLIPPIVDAFPDHPVTGNLSARWLLSGIGGELLDTSMTLRQNAVQDGQLILLTSSPVRPPRRRAGDSSGVVAAAANRVPSTGQCAAAAVGGVVAIASSAMLAWTGAATGAITHLWTAAALSAAGAAAAVAIKGSGNRKPTVFSVAAVLFAMASGFLVQPDASWASVSLLVASPGFAISILLSQLTIAEPEVLHALGALTFAMATTAVIGLAADLPFPAAGPILTVLSLVALSAAPRLTVIMAGLDPSRPEIDDGRAQAGHRMFTGLVAGWSLSAALGVVAAGAVGISGAVSSSVTAIFAADVGALLLLRLRSHIDVSRRITLAAAGCCAWAATYIVAGCAAPEHAPWLCAIAILAGMAAMGWSYRTDNVNPVVRQGLQIIEYLVLAALVPLAAWVAGVYGVVRELSLG